MNYRGYLWTYLSWMQLCYEVTYSRVMGVLLTYGDSQVFHDFMFLSLEIWGSILTFVWSIAVCMQVFRSFPCVGHFHLPVCKSFRSCSMIHSVCFVSCVRAGFIIYHWPICRISISLIESWIYFIVENISYTFLCGAFATRNFELSSYRNTFLEWPATTLDITVFC